MCYKVHERLTPSSTQVCMHAWGMRRHILSQPLLVAGKDDWEIEGRHCAAKHVHNQKHAAYALMAKFILFRTNCLLDSNSIRRPYVKIAIGLYHTRSCFAFISTKMEKIWELVSDILTHESPAICHYILGFLRISIGYWDVNQSCWERD